MSWAAIWNVAWTFLGFVAPIVLIIVALGQRRLSRQLPMLLVAAATLVLWESGALHAAELRIPAQSAGYRLHVERCEAQYFGLRASPARAAAQLHAESGWRADARSPFADGLAQFTPATAAWLPQVCPEMIGFDPWDPNQSICASACFRSWLHRMAPRAASACDRWAFVMSAYNGGLGWLRRDVRLTAQRGDDPSIWFGNVEKHSTRARWAWEENRTYVERVLLTYERAYLAAGWDGQAVCP